MTTFNSISEIVNEIANFNSVANFNKEPFILVPSYTGEYIPNWDIITEDGPNAKLDNKFLTLPDDDIMGKAITNHIRKGKTNVIVQPR